MDYSQTTDTVTLTSSDVYTTSMTAPVTIGPLTTDTLTITAALDNALSNGSDGSSGPYTVTGAIGTSFPNAIWTTTGTGSTNTAPWFSSNPTGASIQLNGENADIKVNDWSLVDAVKRIEERLALLQPNPGLEEEWAELKALGDKYREVEAKCLEKAKMWKELKS